MEALPAKGIVRMLYTLALAGFALSISSHVVALLGVRTPNLLKFDEILIFSVFPVGLTAIMAQSGLQSGFSFVDHLRLMFSPRRARAVRQKMYEEHLPKWLRVCCQAVVLYTAVLFFWRAYETYPSTTMGKGDALLIFSAFSATFYAAFATIFSCYLDTERPLRPDEV